MSSKEPDGVELIRQERARQIELNSSVLSDASANSSEQLALAAAVYAIPHVFRTIYAGAQGHSNIQRVLWPWAWWEFSPAPNPGSLDPKGRIQELQKAGALIAAEIDRLLAGASKK